MQLCSFFSGRLPIQQASTPVMSVTIIKLVQRPLKTTGKLHLQCDICSLPKKHIYPNYNRPLVNLRSIHTQHNSPNSQLVYRDVKSVFLPKCSFQLVLKYTNFKMNVNLPLCDQEILQGISCVTQAVRILHNNAAFNVAGDALPGKF